eukprot:10213181-Heterocapsa_arctica.AAC.1
MISTLATSCPAMRPDSNCAAADASLSAAAGAGLGVEAAAARKLPPPCRDTALPDTASHSAAPATAFAVGGRTAATAAASGSPQRRDHTGVFLGHAFAAP